MVIVAGAHLDHQNVYALHMIAARCCGAAARLTAKTTAFAKTRIQFGKQIANDQTIQFTLANSPTELWATRLLTYRTSRTADNSPSSLFNVQPLAPLELSCYCTPLPIGPK